MSRFISKYAVCPFYHCNDTNRIRCEGVCERNTINLVFEDNREAITYEKRYCDSMDNHKNCLVYQMQNKKWEGKKNG